MIRSKLSVVNRGLPSFIATSQSDAPKFASSQVYSAESVLFCCRFCPFYSGEDILAISDEIGYLTIVNTQTCDEKVWQAHPNALFDVAWVPYTNNQLLSASGDLSVVLWDVNTQQKVNVFCGHTGSVKNISCAPFNDSIFASGSRDGCVLVWDKRDRRRGPGGACLPVNKIDNAHVTSTNNTPLTANRRNKAASSTAFKRLSAAHASNNACPSVTSTVFVDDNQLVSTCSSGSGCSSDIRLWDLRKSYTLCKAKPKPALIFQNPVSSKKKGYSCLTVDRYRSKLYAVCTDNIIYEYSLTNLSPNPVSQLHGPRVSSYFVQATANLNSDLLLTGSSDGKAFIYDLSKNKCAPIKYPSYVLSQGYDCEVSGVSWSRNGEKIVSLDDNNWRLWKYETQIEAHVSDSGDRRLCIEPYTPPVKENVCKSSVVNEFVKMVVSPVKLMNGKRKRAHPFASPLKKISKICLDQNDKNLVAGPRKCLQNLPNFVLDEWEGKTVLKGQSVKKHIKWMNNNSCDPTKNWLGNLAKSLKVPNAQTQGLSPPNIRKRAVPSKMQAKENVKENVKNSQPINRSIKDFYKPVG